MGKLSLLLFTMCTALASHSNLNVQAQDLPTVYEYFTSGGITSGLTADTPGFFKLNGKDLRILSGALHYYRIHPSLWRDRLQKLRTLGCNTVETYIPWNLHEPQRGVFDFGNGGNDMSEFLNLRRFIQMAQEEDLLVLFRPGPYICTEWDFGGLPSWLQQDPNMKVRTGYDPYIERVRIYFNNLIPRITDLVFTRGGPIIAAQIENEYASFNPIDKQYLEFIKQNFESNGLDCLHFTSDAAYNGFNGSLDGIFLTANFQTNPEGNLNDLLKFQPNRPVMVMEYWSGWFDHWFEQHHTIPTTQFAQVLETILDKYNGSVNFYMFHGGTNFGFMAGANSMSSAPFYAADVTSYDYDCPLSESGDYTDKYLAAQTLLEKYQVPVLHRPARVEEKVKQAYSAVTLESYLTFEDILLQIPSTSKFTMQRPVSMEMLPMNGGSGQSYGYILYRTYANIRNGTALKAGPIKDYGILMVNGEIQATKGGTSLPGENERRYLINIDLEADLEVPIQGEYMIDILVENMARVNFGYANDFLQQKGIPSGTYLLDGVQHENFEIVALEFKSNWVKSLRSWRPLSTEKVQTPAIFKATLTISGIPNETFIDMTNWTKGIVFVNGFNLGRYFEVGPQQTLYIPAALLTTGENTIIVFEQLNVGDSIEFRDRPILAG